MAERASSVDAIQWEECLLERRPDAAITEHVRRRIGRVPEYVDYYTPAPWLARNVSILTPDFVGLKHTDQRFGHLIAVVVSQDNSCRYCYAAHRVLLKILGLDEDRIAALETDLLTADLSAAERAGLDFARRVSRHNPAPDRADRDRLLELGYSREAVKELVFVAALAVSANRFATLPAIPTGRVEGMSTHPVVRLLRPVIGYVLRSRFRSFEPRAVALDDVARPFSYLVRALDELPIAAELGGFVDEAWASDILTPRCKALMVAVVARTLGSDVAEREARRLSAKEGFGDAQVDDVLANLAAPDLDPVETIAIPFARESVRYEPMQIQRRARAVREKLTVEQFVELVGIAALANGLCRMTLLADEPRPAPGAGSR